MLTLCSYIRYLLHMRKELSTYHLRIDFLQIRHRYVIALSDSGRIPPGKRRYSAVKFNLPLCKNRSCLIFVHAQNSATNPGVLPCCGNSFLLSLCFLTVCVRNTFAFRNNAARSRDVYLQSELFHRFCKEFERKYKELSRTGGVFINNGYVDST